MANIYVALIGDIVKSRQIDRRKEFQAKLEEALNKINHDFEQFVEAEFLVTVGDEFQGLLKPSAPVYKIICVISEAIYPVQVRLGLGLGGINTPVKEKALGMDGPVFYAAREALNIAHNRRKDHAVVFKPEPGVLDKSSEEEVNIMLGSLAVIKKLWPGSFYEILPYLREGKKQKEIAGLIGTTQPYISKLINNACWKEVVLLEERVEFLLNNYFTGATYYNGL